MWSGDFGETRQPPKKQFEAGPLNSLNLKQH